MISRAFLGFTPTQMEGGPIVELLQNDSEIKLPIEAAYIPETLQDIRANIQKIMMQCDHNPAWYHPHTCTHCGRKGVKYTELHRIITCEKYRKQRQLILESLTTERARYRKQWKGTKIFTDEAIDRLVLDAMTEEHYIKNSEELKEITGLLLGTRVNPELKKEHKEAIKRMLISHLVLLNDSSSQEQQEQITEYIKVPYDQQEIFIATEDLKEGKIVARIKQNDGSWFYQNVREIIESLSAEDMENYNVGLGAVGTRTYSQKVRALKKKLDIDSPLKLDILTNRPDIIALQEHMLSKETRADFERNHRITGYTLKAFERARKPESKRNTAGRGSGGLAIWAKNTLLENYNFVEAYHHKEVLQLTITEKKTNQHVLHIYNTYIPPITKESEAKEHLDHLLAAYDRNNSEHSVITGDINCRTEELGDKITQNKVN